MSHFTVIVIGPNHERQLAPFHEFECTGTVDEFVQSIDETEECREGYESATESMVRLADGSLVCAYDDRFYRDPTPEEMVKHGPMLGSGGGGGISYQSKDWGDGLGYRPKVRDLAGAEEVEVKRSERESFLAYVMDHGKKAVPFGEQPDLEGVHKYGWVEVDAAGEVVKVIDRTNPDKRWDWYSIGGRWSGFFPLKAGAGGALGRPGVFDNKARPQTADQCRWGDVDLARARNEAVVKALVEFDKWRGAFERHGKPQSWADVREAHPGDMDKAREVYNAQPAIREMKAWTCPVSEYGFDVDAYVKRCTARALVPFAVVKDGKWYEKGSMGWWGMVADEQDQNAWNAQVAALFDGLDPDTQVTLVDCHI
jgi:hypothetical protein